MQNKLAVIVVSLAAISEPLFAEGQLLIRSGFEPPVQIAKNMARIVGQDYADGLGWEVTSSWIASARFLYRAGQSKELSEFMASYITETTGPFGIRSHVLCMQNKANDPDINSTSRNEYGIFGREPPYDYRQGYVRYWMKLQGDLPDRIATGRLTPSYMIMEWKEPNSRIKHSDEACHAVGERPAGTNNYRINIGIQRSAGEAAFRWVFHGQQVQPCRKTEWSYVNPDVDVPIGQWFLMEAFMKKHAKDGRVYFAVNEEVVLDTDQVRPTGFTGRTQHADNPLELQFWSPLKNYHSMKWNRDGPISQWYDEFELWTDFPPGHPAVRR